MRKRGKCLFQEEHCQGHESERGRQFGLCVFNLKTLEFVCFQDEDFVICVFSV